MTNFAAFIVSGWETPRPSRLQVAGMAERIFGERRRHAESFVISGFAILIAVQWLFVGAMPVAPKRYWLEPGNLITALALCSFVMIFAHPLHQFSALPMLIAVVTGFLSLSRACEDRTADFDGDETQSSGIACDKSPYR